MAGIKKLALKRNDRFWLDPLIIRELPGWNPRIPRDELEEHILELAESIKENGVQKPVTVFMDAGVPTLVDGHCRMAAVHLLISKGHMIDKIPVLIDEDNKGEDSRCASILTSGSSLPLTMMEQADVIKRLFIFGWSKERILKYTGFSPSKLANLVSLAEATPAVVEMVITGEVSPSNAASAIRQNGPNGGEEKLAGAVKRAKADGRKKAVGADIQNEEKTSDDQFKDGFHSGMIHALALICEEEITDRVANKTRDLLFGDGPINALLASPGDIQILRCHFHDV